MFTTWGPVRGCCGHAHRTREAAEACIDRDDRGCKAGCGRDAYSDRGVRVIDHRDPLEAFSTTQGPGRRLRPNEGGEHDCP